ncbi:hypothetical protein B0H11DRAFT_1914996 [Mycena galericulata]|nr:hypothetical protein B0H11DRAFT_1914996 [Mycena galericulata]
MGASRLQDEDEILLGEDIKMDAVDNGNAMDDVVMINAALTEQVLRSPVTKVEPGFVPTILMPHGRHLAHHKPYAAQWARCRSFDDDRHYVPSSKHRREDRSHTRSRSCEAPTQGTARVPAQGSQDVPLAHHHQRPDSSGYSSRRGAYERAALLGAALAPVPVAEVFKRTTKDGNLIMDD